MACKIRRIIIATYTHFCLKSYAGTGTCANTTPARISLASSTLLRLFREYIMRVAMRTLPPQYSSACCWVKMASAEHSSREGSRSDAYAVSGPTICTTSWSLSHPIALSATMMGISSVKVLCRR